MGELDSRQTAGGRRKLLKVLLASGLVVFLKELSRKFVNRDGVWNLSVGAWRGLQEAVSDLDKDELIAIAGQRFGVGVLDPAKPVVIDSPDSVASGLPNSAAALLYEISQSHRSEFHLLSWDSQSLQVLLFTLFSLPLKWYAPRVGGAPVRFCLMEEIFRKSGVNQDSALRGVCVCDRARTPYDLSSEDDNVVILNKSSVGAEAEKLVWAVRLLVHEMGHSLITRTSVTVDGRPVIDPTLVRAMEIIGVRLWRGAPWAGGQLMATDQLFQKFRVGEVMANRLIEDIQYGAMDLEGDEFLPVAVSIYILGRAVFDRCYGIFLEPYQVDGLYNLVKEALFDGLEYGDDLIGKMEKFSPGQLVDLSFPGDLLGNRVSPK